MHIERHTDVDQIRGRATADPWLPLSGPLPHPHPHPLFLFPHPPSFSVTPFHSNSPCPKATDSTPFTLSFQTVYPNILTRTEEQRDRQADTGQSKSHFPVYAAQASWEKAPERGTPEWPGSSSPAPLFYLFAYRDGPKAERPKTASLCLKVQKQVKEITVYETHLTADKRIFFD